MTAQRLLENRIALVTGGGTGLGAAIASGLSDQGASVVVAGPDMAPLHKTVAAIEAKGGKGWAYALDVCDRAACHALAQRVAAEAGDVSILINNAGIIRYATMDDPAVDAAWDDVMDVNLSGQFNVARAFLAPLKATRGAIVNLSSVNAFNYTNNTVAYSASKGGVLSLTVAMSRELGPFGIRVNAIAPGPMNTSMSPTSSDPSRRAMVERRVALGRIGEPEELVGPVVFFVSGMSSYVTGTTLLVDGGYLTF
jgi:NAD(P)-dependent dehydrogenase (short-subunit alcohol dehydrogenase family)